MTTYTKNLLKYNDVRNEYECAREDGHEAGLQEGREKGIQEGLQQGIQQGVMQGIQQGMQNMQKGIRQTTYEIAQKCIQEGISLDLVIRITGLSPEELREIRLG